MPDPESREVESSHNQPWVFGLVTLTYGFATCVSTILIPFVLRKYGVPVDQIAGVVAIAMIPAAWSFFVSPVADAGISRRHCVLFCALGAAVAAPLAILRVHGSLGWLTILLFLAYACAGLHSTATGGLLTNMPASLRGRASGWTNAGNLGGGAIGGGVFIWLAGNAPLPVLAVVVGGAIALPTLLAFVLIEEPAPARRALGPLVRDLVHDLREIFVDRRTWFGLFLFVSPAGSFAIGNLISGLGPDYHAATTEVLFVSGVGGGLLAAAGCFVGIFFADRVNRMAAYAFTALFAAICGVYLALGPATPVTYGAGYLCYALASGFSYCMFTALVLDVVGPRRHAGATAYALLNASGNLAISYMVWLDGLGYKHWGTRGLMGTDAAANGVAAVAILLVTILVQHDWNRAAKRPSGSPAESTLTLE